jgi:hypothetical protein
MKRATFDTSFGRRINTLAGQSPGKDRDKQKIASSGIPISNRLRHSPGFVKAKAGAHRFRSTPLRTGALPREVKLGSSLLGLSEKSAPFQFNG